MIISAVVSVLLPVILFVYFRKKYNISMKVLGAGILTFMIFSQVLEKLMHMAVIKSNLFPTPLAFAVYGALAAGIFEETGRFIVMKLFLKDNREWKDGIAFGIGHGGIEAILIGAMMNVQYIMISQMINNNTFNQSVLDKAGSNPSIIQSMLTLHDTLVNTAPILFSLGALERIFALIIHIGASVLILYAVKNKKLAYLFLAIFIHALIDFFPALAQAGFMGTVQVELVLAVFAVLILIFIIKSKKIFNE
ncbi:hypothetical protein HMPREF1982_03133 [Clostridiales bacterium oral taxon 876 str. F0540]|nr:hypothetical protein HMPREF1982_03133 [Clostridiales bacterium oral taxon 876 str. F0540]